MGVTSNELMADFEIAIRILMTGITMTRRGKEARDANGKGNDSVTQRAHNFAAASRRVLDVYAKKKPPQKTSVKSLMLFGARSVPGLDKTPEAP